MEIILLLLGDKCGDSEQYECFSLAFIQHSANTTTSNHQINTRMFSKGEGVMDSTHFSSIVSHLYIKKNRTRHLDASDPLPLNTNLITIKN